MSKLTRARDLFWPRPVLAAGENLSWSELCNRQLGWRSVGGSFSVTTAALYFAPNRLDALFRAQAVRIARSEIVEVLASPGSVANFEVRLRDGSTLELHTSDPVRLVREVNRKPAGTVAD